MQVIKFEQKDTVGHIVLANPPKNLIASNFSDSLKRAVHEAGESNIRALLVRAEGPNFSQGGDVLDFLEKDANQFRTFIGECNQSFRAIEALQIPTVAAVRGAAFGGAFELALACDFIVAAEDAVFRCIEASVGSAPVAGAVQRLAEPFARSALCDALRADVGRCCWTIGYRQLCGASARGRSDGTEVRAGFVDRTDALIRSDKNLAEGLVGRRRSFCRCSDSGRHHGAAQL